MNGGFNRRERDVVIPDGASAEEEQELIAEATDAMIDEVLDDLGL